MKKVIITFLIFVLIVVSVLYLSLFTPGFHHASHREQFQVNQDKIQIKTSNGWEDFKIKGMNIGTGYPGIFPNEYGIDQATYMRWFQLIADMHANTIRVYKQQSPAFYQAFAEYNQQAENKLYLLQGVDFSEHFMYSSANILKTDVYKTLLTDTLHVVDAIHGDYLTFDSNTNTLHAYMEDVSDYVIGYILGIEWDEMYVEYICRINEEIAPYQGTYLKADEKANPFESFLARWGDDVLTYEEDTYGTQKLITYCNWPLTDPFYNEFELRPKVSSNVVKDSEILIDIEHIQVKKNCESGLFASYNVYPYYPYFLQYGEYSKHYDEQGKRNPYLMYLKHLTSHHKYPVVISEYGTPASRSTTYEDIWKGIDHGGLNEHEQALAIKAMYHEINHAGCAGSIAFTWQDEWYKKAWNESLLVDRDNRSNWANAECSEQGFGVLDFQTQAQYEQYYPDDTIKEWQEDNILYQDEDVCISMHSDEKYVYLMLKDDALKDSTKPIVIGFDLQSTLGNHQYKDIHFPQAVDFILDIQKHKATLKVVDEYDSLVFSALGGYNEQSLYIIEKIEETITKEIDDNQAFQVVKRAKGNIYDTLDAKWSICNAGVLSYGNSHPKASNYNSNADFYREKDYLEVRIPWQLLNFYDPSNRQILNNFRNHNYKIEAEQIDAMYIYYHNGKNQYNHLRYELSSWKKPTHHERLKEAYYVLQSLYKEDIDYAN